MHVTYLGNIHRRRKREEQGQRREGSQAAVHPANEAPAWCSRELLPWSEESGTFIFLNFSVMDWEWRLILKHLPLSVLPAKQPLAAQTQSPRRQPKVLPSGSKRKCKGVGILVLKWVRAEHHHNSLYSPINITDFQGSPDEHYYFNAQRKRALNLGSAQDFCLRDFPLMLLFIFYGSVNKLLYFSIELNSMTLPYLGWQLPRY